MKKLLYVLTSLCLVAGIFTGCEKESEKANSTIKGVVTAKETGEPLSGVMIELQPIGKQVQTAEDGTYIFENLKAGAYTLRAQKDGYVDYIKEEIQLVADQVMSFDVEMEEDEYKAESDYTVTTYGLNMGMVYVSGGEFNMGATAEQGGSENDNPVRTIRLDGYHIGKYEVTQEQWQKVMGTSVREQADKVGISFFYGEGENNPMYYVNWEEAQEFCLKLSEATGKKYVLPTEAQWEYAARGGNTSQQYRYAGKNVLREVAWYIDNSNRSTQQVGGKQSNELGIYDMSGNVAEWCSDWYGSYSNDTENPQGPMSGTHRVHRGGHWNNEAVDCRVASRKYSSPDTRNYFLGFRVACIAE